MVRAGSIGDRVHAELRDEILTGRLAAGAPLSEVELADRLGVSRTPLRAALARLALEGLVDTTRGRTGVVSEVSAQSVAELFELREVLEVAAARLAARRGDAALFQRLADEFAAADAVLADGGADAYYDVIRRFDAAVDAAVANRPLRLALEASRTHLVRARRLAQDDPARLTAAAEEHARICAAIAGGDEELAAAATLLHLRASLAVIATRLGARTDTQESA